MLNIHFNKLCHIEDWHNPWFRLALRTVQEEKNIGQIIHRKYWEWALGILASAISGLLIPEAKVLGLGAGHEFPIFFFTKFAKWVFSTDIYGKSKFTDHEADEIMMLRPEIYAPFPFQREKLIVEFMDMTDLRFPDDSIDILFCFSSIEHLSSLEKTKKAFSEMLRVVKPGGLLLITTEYIIKKLRKKTSEEVEAFSKKDIQKVFFNQKNAIPIDTPDFSISEKTLKTLQLFSAEDNLPDPSLPHIVLQSQDVIFTSIFLGFWKKPMKKSVSFLSFEEAKKLPYFDDPHFYSEPQGIVFAPKNIKVKTGDSIIIDLKLKNLGETLWHYSLFSSTPLYILDSHIFTQEREEVKKHFCCIPIEKEVAPGESLKQLYKAAINLKPGKYILRFNFANCKNEWFGKDGISSWAGEIILQVK